MQHLRTVNFLKSNGLSSAKIKETLSAFEGTPKLKTLKADSTVYRVHGGNSIARGPWVSPNNYGVNARAMLSLPPWNTATNTSTIVISRGTKVLTGVAAPLFGQPGGGIQWWVSILL